MSSTVTQLRSTLQEMTSRLASWIRDIPVNHFNSRSRNILIVAPDYYWGEPSPEQRNAQIAIKRDYDGWYELLRSVLRNAPNDITRKIESGNNKFRIWLELQTNWSLSNDRQANDQKLREEVAELFQVLEILGSGKASVTILIPDTNSIVSTPDPTQYRGVAGSDTFVFLLLPAVLSELDKLKNLHRNPDFREKAIKTITRIKGWRGQGSLFDGVTVDGTITVKAIAKEPDMEHALSWLDPEIIDDRIIASVLEVQACDPTAMVILVTGDINLLNKADAARIPHIET